MNLLSNNDRKLGHGGVSSETSTMLSMARGRNSSMTDAFIQLHIDPLGPYPCTTASYMTGWLFTPRRPLSKVNLGLFVVRLVR